MTHSHRWVLSLLSPHTHTPAHTHVYKHVHTHTCVYTHAQVHGFLYKNFLLLGLVVGVGLAALHPFFGRVGGPLKPEVTVNVIGKCGPRMLYSHTFGQTRIHTSAHTHTLLIAYTWGWVPRIPNPSFGRVERTFQA